jgi:hypothetical protein
MDVPAQPLSCSLDGSDLPARLHAWRQVVARATTCRVEDELIVTTYPKDPQLRERLRELIALEGRCCSFLRFDVDERPDAIVTELRLPENVAGATRAGILEVFGG